jgi:hypothetical protein
MNQDMKNRMKRFRKKMLARAAKNRKSGIEETLVNPLEFRLLLSEGGQLEYTNFVINENPLAYEHILNYLGILFKTHTDTKREYT